MKRVNCLLTMFAALLACLVLASESPAGCRAVAVHRNVVVEKVIVKEVVAAVVTPVVAVYQAVAVPLYSAVYSPAPAYAAPAYPAYGQPAAVAPCAKHEATLDRVASILDSLDRRLSALEGGPTRPPLRTTPAPMEKVPEGAQGPTAPAPGGDRLLALATKHCASCHDQSRAAASGKGFVLVSGGRLAPLSEIQLGNIIDQVGQRKMPRGGQMSDTERLDFISLLVNSPPSK